jgi:hypothetical protein
MHGDSELAVVTQGEPTDCSQVVVIGGVANVMSLLQIPEADGEVVAA